jgi:ATP-dependent protease ClpP protease subunit
MKFILSLLLLTSSIAFGRTIELNDTNTVVLNDYFDSISVTRVTERLKELDQDSTVEDEPIFLVINSGGGSIFAGLELINFAKGLNREVHTISHFAASMAFETVQSLGDRLVFDYGVLMSHKARGVAYGEYPGQLDNRLAMNKRIVDLMEKQAVRRTSGKLTIEKYRNLIENEYWCVDTDCKKTGFIDEVVSARCDESLAGTHDLTDTFFLQGAKVDVIYSYSNCPLQTYVTNYIIKVNGNIIHDSASKPDFSGNLHFRQVEKRIQKRLNGTNRKVFKEFR